MRAARYHPPNTIRVAETPRPSPAPGEILVRVDVCGLCGSDVAKFAHGRGAGGDVLGHEVAGIVEEAPPPTDGAPHRFAPGDRVVVAHHAPCFECHYCAHGNFSMCRTFKASNLAPGGFAEYFVASSAHVATTAFVIPPTLSFEAATFMEPIACALKAMPRLNLRPGDLAVVYGLGPMGILFARLISRYAGARVVGVEPIEERRAAARSSVVAAFAPGDDALSEFVRAETAGRGADGAVLCAGRGSLAAEAVALVRDAGAICLFAASPADSSVALPLSLVYYREVILYGSYSPGPDGYATALSLLSNRTILVEDLISHRLPLEETQRAFEMAMRGEGLKIMLRPGARPSARESATRGDSE
ncbi:MAG: alcohol dehydrogenase catalytic domain-containing protein [bacterium]